MMSSFVNRGSASSLSSVTASEPSSRSFVSASASASVTFSSSSETLLLFGVDALKNRLCCREERSPRTERDNNDVRCNIVFTCVYVCVCVCACAAHKPNKEAQRGTKKNQQQKNDNVEQTRTNASEK
mmetsp:Transcript_5516/g.16864  ORF Transcript_5516/g.16864 Transcript_5516/m.16864 type:complete len:127 (-) Transcript_5516:75-455(-)